MRKAMRSFTIHKTDWSSRKQIAHFLVLMALGIAVLFTAFTLTSPLTSHSRFKIKFSKAIVSRPTAGGQGVHYRNRTPTDGPDVYPRTYDAWVRVGDLVCEVSVDVLRP